MKMFLFEFFYIFVVDAVYQRRNVTVDNALINYIGVVKNDNMMLNVDNISSVNVLSVTDCVTKCLYHPVRCLSMNFYKDSKEAEDNCFLLKENRYSNVSLYNYNTSFIHLNVKNSGCEKQPCLNGGTCIPNFNDDTYQCACAGLFHGVYCNLKIYVKANWIFTFNDEDIKNTGSTPDSLSFSLDKGKLVYLPERVGKVLRCNEDRCMNTFMSFPNWMDPNHFTNGISISLWVKLVNNEEKDGNSVDPQKTHTYLIEQKYRGFSILYYHGSSRWYFQAYNGSHFHGAYFPRSYKSAQRWQHLAMVFDTQQAQKMRGYVDGVACEKLSYGHTVTNQGDTDGWNFFERVWEPKNDKFYIDDFMVWFDVLSELYIEDIYTISKH